jgi:hypothetical protein
MELARYKLDLVGVLEVRWDKSDTAKEERYTLFYRPLGRPSSRREDNIKMDLREVGGGYWLRIGTGDELL